MKWFLDHARVVLAIVVFGLIAVISGVVMISSFASYKKYEQTYYKNDLEVRSVSQAAPKTIEIDDNFVTYANNGAVKSSKSSYKKNATAWAENMTYTTTQEGYALIEGENKLDSYLPSLSAKGGTISVKFNLEDKSFVDIDFVLSSAYSKNDDHTTKDLLSVVTFKVNGATMEEVVDLENDGTGLNWHHVAMTNFALPAGEITIEIASVKNKTAYMPDIRNISVFANANVALA